MSEQRSRERSGGDDATVVRSILRGRAAHTPARPALARIQNLVQGHREVMIASVALRGRGRACSLVFESAGRSCGQCRGVVALGTLERSAVPCRRMHDALVYRAAIAVEQKGLILRTGIEHRSRGLAQLLLPPVVMSIGLGRIRRPAALRPVPLAGLDRSARRPRVACWCLYLAVLRAQSIDLAPRLIVRCTELVLTHFDEFVLHLSIDDTRRRGVALAACLSGSFG